MSSKPSSSLIIVVEPETIASLLVFAHSATLSRPIRFNLTLNEARGMASYLWQTITTTCGIKGRHQPLYSFVPIASCMNIAKFERAYIRGV